MVVTFNMDEIFPLFNNNIFTVTGLTSNSTATVQFDLIFDNYPTFTTILSPDQYGVCYLYLDYILQNYFSTSVYLNKNNLYETNNNPLLKFSVTITSFINSTIDDYQQFFNFYCLNSVIQGDESINMYDYFMSATHKGKFLSKYTYDRNVSTDSKAYLSILTGYYDLFSLGKMSEPSKFHGINIKAYQNDGSTKSLNNNTSYLYQDPVITSIDCSISKINSLSSNFIDSNTVYYTVKEVSGYSETVKFNVIREQKVKNNFNVLYVNSLGVTDYFDFVKASQKDLNIDRQTFMNNSNKKVYNQEIENKKIVSSDWLTESQSEALTDLWNSPVLKINNKGKIYDAVLLNSQVTVLNRFQSKLISYEIEFEPSTTQRSLKI